MNTRRLHLHTLAIILTVTGVAGFAGGGGVTIDTASWPFSLTPGFGLMPFGDSGAESQRDSGSKPRVARNELPWETRQKADNPNGVAARPRKRDATPMGLKPHRAATQGSSFLATLGWQTQSLWDCGTSGFSGAGKPLKRLAMSAQVDTGLKPGANENTNERVAAPVKTTTNSSLLGMVVISGGIFKPQFRSTADLKEVSVKPFCLDVLPVTNDDFLQFVRANPRWQRSVVKRLFADETYLKSWAGDLEPGTNAPANAPVTFVSWFAAKTYAQWRAKRLPTLAEWELVAAAGATQPDGANDPDFKRALQSWYSTPSDKRLSPVGAGPKNYWGVHDLHGLVWEWVADFNTAMVTGDARGDTGLDRQLFCGSGAVGARDPGDYAAFMRYGFRSSLKADYCIHNLGFRCAKDL